MTKLSSTVQSKFESLSKEDLFKLCLEQEDELEKLRPKPPKFKLGQLVKAPASALRSIFAGQPAVYFIVLSLERRNDTWYYGYQKKSNTLNAGFMTLPEKVLQSPSQAEIEGGALPPELAQAAPASAQASAQGMHIGPAGTYYMDEGQY